MSVEDRVANVSAAEQRRSRTRRRQLRTGALSALAGAASLAFACLVWEVAVRVFEITHLLPPPSRIFSTAVALTEDGVLYRHMSVSVRRALQGFVIGSVLAIFSGLLTGRVTMIRVLLEPVLQVLRPIPGIAWVPMAILWFGVGETPKLFLIALGVFFPVWLNTHLGVQATPRIYLEVAESVGLRRLEVFYKVVLPAALPFVVSGLRVGFAIAFILLVAAELVGASVGLGALISHSHLIFRPDRMVVGMALLGVIGALADFLFSRVIKRAVYWE